MQKQQRKLSRERNHNVMKRFAVFLLSFFLLLSLSACSFLDSVFSNLSSLAGLQQTLIMAVPAPIPVPIFIEVAPAGYLKLSEDCLALLQKSLPDIIETLHEPPEEDWYNGPIWNFTEHSLYMGFSHLDRNGNLQDHSRSNLLNVPVTTLIQGMPESLTMEELARTFFAVSVFYEEAEDAYFLEGRYGTYKFIFLCDASGTVHSSGYVYILDVTEGTL